MAATDNGVALLETNLAAFPPILQIANVLQVLRSRQRIRFTLLVETSSVNEFLKHLCRTRRRRFRKFRKLSKLGAS